MARGLAHRRSSRNSFESTNAVLWRNVLLTAKIYFFFSFVEGIGKKGIEKEETKITLNHQLSPFFTGNKGLFRGREGGTRMCLE